MRKKLIEQAYELIKDKRIDYGDIRFVETEVENILVKNGKVEKISVNINSGMGVRILLNGHWGFSSSSKINKKALLNNVKNAFNIAYFSNIREKDDPIVVDKFQPVKDYYTTPIEKDPFKIPVKEKIDMMLEIDRRLRTKSAVKISTVSFSFVKKKVSFINSEDSFIEQTFYYSGGGYSVFAMNKTDMQRRSYPAAFGGNYAQAGFEFIEGMKLFENTERVVDEVTALLKAPPAPSIKGTLLLESNQTALQLHESVGHPLELDRILGYEVSYAGDSFVKLDMFGNYRYGSPLMTVYADATVKGGLGTFKYDDEGVRARKVKMIDKGILKEPMTSRETARKIGKKSNGTMRASNWDRIPLIRMTNINLEMGNMTMEDMIKEVKEGILMETNRSWSIDNKRLNFQFGTEIGWYIKNGKKINMVKNPVYWGITPEFWKNLKGVGNKDTYTLWGIPNCGKGEPGQSMFVGHGVPAIMVKNVEMGSSNS